MSQLAGIILFSGAISQMVGVWNLWNRGALAPEAALKEIGRILKEVDDDAGNLAATMRAEGKPR